LIWTAGFVVFAQLRGVAQNKTKKNKKNKKKPVGKLVTNLLLVEMELANGI
jgi:hypothetical protein